MISILILTLNEEANLPACLESVRWSDDVIVLDSFSTDRTVEIAKTAGVRVFQRAFDDFATQRNYALDSIPFKHPWVFHLDADERFTTALQCECIRVTKEDRFSGFLVPGKMMFMGKWLRWSGMYPSYQLRLLKIGEVRFVQKGHGQREGKTERGKGFLREPYLHYSFSKGMEEWLDKHNQYSTQEAEESFKDNNQVEMANLFAIRDPVVRRRALKSLSARLPCRPTLRFLYMYLLRLGFLDGRAGLAHCRLMAFYEYLIVLKMKEIQRRRAGLS